MVERGIAALYLWLGEGGAFLQRGHPRHDEAACFEYPLPADYLGIERTVRFAFLPGFPRSTLQISIDPSPWLQWPHAMPNGVCLFGLRQRPVDGTPEEIVDECLRRLGQVVALVMPSGDPLRRQAEFEAEIVSYWSQQVTVTLDQLMLFQPPEQATPLLVLSDTRAGSEQVLNSTWLATDANALERQWKRMTGQARPVRDPAPAAFYLPLLSLPTIAVPAADELLEWLKGHVAVSDFKLLQQWISVSAVFTLRWLVLRLPGSGLAHHFALVLRDQCMKPDTHKTYGRRAARRTIPTQTHSRLRELERARVHVLDRHQVHSRDFAQSVELADARVVMVGAGSLGSALSTLLARAGVGHMTLVDPEFLEDANLGRHALGMDDLGYFKAKSLCKRLRRDIPTIEVDALNEYLQVALITHPKVFTEADLVICTSADWLSESCLWRAKASGARWMLLQGWSEPHAQIGHALIAPPGSCDGRPLFDAAGRFHHRLSMWPDDGLQPLAGCGASFIPGGPAALASIAALMAEVALAALAVPPAKPQWHTSIGSPAAIADAGGEYLGPALPEGASRLCLARDWPGAGAPE